MNAPSVFQRLINKALRETLNHYAFVYLDNIVIFSNSLKDHVLWVLQLLLQKGLYMKLEKPQFHVSTSSFLGFMVSRDSQSMTNAIKEWPQPSSVYAG